MKRLTHPAEYEVRGKAEVTALVSVFGVRDSMNDVVMPGAFKKSIAEWKTSGDPIPVIISHDWGNIWSHIGVVDSIRETEKGLEARYTLDVDDNPAAAQVHKLMKRRSLREHSFAYDIRDERPGPSGVTELWELGLIEVGPTLKGANSQTELLSVKSALDALNSGRRPTSSRDFKQLSKLCFNLSDRLKARDGSSELAHYQALIDETSGGSVVSVPDSPSKEGDLAYYQKLIDQASVGTAHPSFEDGADELDYYRNLIEEALKR